MQHQVGSQLGIERGQVHDAGAALAARDNGEEERTGLGGGRPSRDFFLDEISGRWGGFLSILWKIDKPSIFKVHFGPINLNNLIELIQHFY